MPFYFKAGGRAKRLDNGRVVNIVEVRVAGLSPYYVTEDVADGHTAILQDAQLRPLGHDEAKA